MRPGHATLAAMEIGHVYEMPPMRPEDAHTTYFPAGVIKIGGVSLHVFDAEGQWEYLRFDLFDDAPHYHYNHLGGGRNHIIPFDETAHGPIAAWAVGKIRTGEIASMLAQAGAPELAEGLDTGVLGEVADQVAAYAAELQSRLAAAV